MKNIVVTRSVPSVAEAQKGPVVHKDDEAEFARIDQLVLDSSFAFLTSPRALRHPLIVATRSALREGGADDRKIEHPPYRSRSLNIRVGKGNVRRALEFMASLIATAESHGGKITIIEADSRQPSTVFEAYGERVEIKIHETAKRSCGWRRAQLEDPAIATDASGLLSAEAAVEAAQKELDGLNQRCRTGREEG